MVNFRVSLYDRVCQDVVELRRLGVSSIESDQPNDLSGNAEKYVASWTNQSQPSAQMTGPALERERPR
jgi:hypothetical protein